MRYSGVIYNDITAAPGLCVTFFTQGCPPQCHGCHNPQTWDFEGGIEFTSNVLDEIIEGLKEFYSSVADTHLPLVDSELDQHSPPENFRGRAFRVYDKRTDNPNRKHKSTKREGYSSEHYNTAGN